MFHLIAFNLNLETTLLILINVGVDVLLWFGCGLDVLFFITVTMTSYKLESCANVWALRVDARC